jgi:predicted ATP-dependent serine protease
MSNEANAMMNGITPEDILAEVAKFSRSSNQEELFVTRTANQCLEDARHMPIPVDLFKGLVHEGELTILFADTGIGKSILAVQICDAISRSHKVAYIDLELSDKQFQKRYSNNYSDEYQFNENLFRVTFNPLGSIPEGKTYDEFFIESLLKIIHEENIKIVVIDNMTRLVSGDTDTAHIAKPLMDRLSDIKHREGLTLLLLEHTRKTDNTRPISLNDLQGSKMKANFADSIFSIGRSVIGQDVRYIKQLKNRSDEIRYPSEKVLTARITQKGSFLQFVFEGEEPEASHLMHLEKDDYNGLADRVIELSQEGMSQREIARELGCSPTTVNKYLKNKAQSAKDVTPVTVCNRCNSVTEITENQNQQKTFFE